ncbi:MAG TPA: hypothetical protein VHX12_08540 [Acidisoma sp.]|jgi:hypothetical protein|nr:hypothetical protein [Acidisoma sp.]
MKTIFRIFTVFMLLNGAALVANPSVANAQSSSAAQAANNCYSARRCEGKILNHKDAHNCKNSGGKSWRSGVTGTCTNL